MDDFLQYQRNLLRLILFIGAIIGAGLWLFWTPHAEAVPVALGWWAGCAAGAWIFHQRVRSVLRLPELPREKWAGASIKASLTAYAVMIGVVVAAIVWPLLNAYAVLAGILLERVVLRADGWIRPGALDAEAAQAAPPAEPTPNAEAETS